MMRSLRPNRLEVFAMAAMVVTTFLFFGAALDAASLYTSVQVMSASKQAVGCIGWLVATLGPITISVAFWRLFKFFRHGWLFHFLMLPLGVLMLKSGASLMVFATGTHTDFDDTLGGPVLQAYALFFLTIPAYYSAVAYAAFGRNSGRANGS